MYLEAGWLKFDGVVSRSWGVRAKGREGDARTDYVKGPSEFCSVECLVKALDQQRKRKNGPEPVPYRDPKLPLAVADPFKEKPKPWEDPIPDDEPHPSDKG